MDAVFHPIGTARTAYAARGDCPKQGAEGAAAGRVVLDPAFARAAAELSPGKEIWVLTWLDKADTGALAVHPRSDRNLPLTGVFSTRSPDRPCPIGLHRCRITAVSGLEIAVDALEAADGTPVLDIKPVIGGDAPRPPLEGAMDTARTDEAVAAIIRAGRLGWERGVFSGRNGNISMRLGETVLITASGASKGRLTPDDILAVNLAGGAPCGGPGRTAKPSSEMPAHLCIYRAQSEAMAVVHTHPPHLLALDQALPEGKGLFDLTLYETEVYKEKYATVPPLPPGGERLGEIVGKTARHKEALLMRRHGLICWGKSIEDALALTEEIEGLARVRWLMLAGER